MRSASAPMSVLADIYHRQSFFAPVLMIRKMSCPTYPATSALLHFRITFLYPFNLHLKEDKDTLRHAGPLVHLVLILSQVSHDLADRSSCNLGYSVKQKQAKA